MASTRSRAPKLATLYQHLRHQAEATGRDQASDLFKGARLAVRVRDGQVTLTVSRKTKPVGSVEINTFLGHCKVPATAIRWPEQGQNTREADGTIWHYIAWRWLIADEGSEEVKREEKPAPEPKPDPNRTVWVCQVCEEGGEFTTDGDFRQHVFEAHGITASDIKTAKSESSMHLNMRPYFQTHTSFVLEDGRKLVLVIQHTGPRR